MDVVSTKDLKPASFIRLRRIFNLGNLAQRSILIIIDANTPTGGSGVMNVTKLIACNNSPFNKSANICKLTINEKLELKQYA